MAAVVAAIGATFDDTDQYVVESINADIYGASQTILSGLEVRCSVLLSYGRTVRMCCKRAIF